MGRAPLDGDPGAWGAGGRARRPRPRLGPHPRDGAAGLLRRQASLRFVRSRDRRRLRRPLGHRRRGHHARRPRLRRRRRRGDRPRAVEDEVLGRAWAKVDGENITRDALRAGTSMAEVFGSTASSDPAACSPVPLRRSCPASGSSSLSRPSRPPPRANARFRIPRQFPGREDEHFSTAGRNHREGVVFAQGVGVFEA